MFHMDSTSASKETQRIQKLIPLHLPRTLTVARFSPITHQQHL